MKLLPAGADLALRRMRFRHRALRAPVVRWRHRTLRLEDAFLAAYPRSGTTWLRFLLFEVLTGRESAFGIVRDAVPSVGQQDVARAVLPDGGRIVQTHEPYLDADRRVVYIVRDARSVLLSEYRWQKRSRFFGGTLDDFVADFVAGRCNPWGPWDSHVRYWRDSLAARRDHLLLVRYEDLRRSTEERFAAILAFLGARVGDAELRRAVENNSLEGMRAKQEMARRQSEGLGVRGRTTFVGTGSTEGWRHDLAPEHVGAIETRFGPTLRALGYDTGCSS
jgi:hypothetical protein